MPRLFACLIALCSLATPLFAAQIAGADAQRPWTILVYGAADNNADGPILHFLDAVRRAIDDDPGIELLLLIDRSEKHSDSAALLGEDFSGARLFRLTKDAAERLDGGTHFPGITTTSDAEIDSADPANIRRFIAWGKERYPARNTCLLIYSHANGRTMCPDEHTPRDMDIAELSDALSAAEHVEVLALELCNMGGVEIAYQWRPGPDRFGADVLIAIPNAGPPLDWDRAFARIRSPGHAGPEFDETLDPATMTPLDFGRLVIEEGYRGRRISAARGGGQQEAAGCYDLRMAADVKQAVDALAVALWHADARQALLDVRTATGDAQLMRYDGDSACDLYDLCRRIAAGERMPAAVRSAAERAAEQVDRFIVASFGMTAYRGFEPDRNGAFIMLPADDAEGRALLKWYTPRPGAGRDYGRWAFLADGATPGNGRVENWFELLDWWFDGPSDEPGANGYRP